MSEPTVIARTDDEQASDDSSKWLTVLGATYDGQTVSATWQWATPPQGWVPTSYSLSVRVAGQEADITLSNDPPVTSGSLPVPFPLRPGWGLFMLAKLGTTNLDNFLVLLLTQPVLQSLRYDVTTLTVIASWAPPPAQGPQLLNYAIGILAPDGTVIASTTVPGSSTTGTAQLSAPLPPDGGYRALLTANGLSTWSSINTPSSSTTTAPLLTDVPQLLSVDYDGGSISAVWTPLTNSTPPVTSWVLRAYTQAGTLQSFTIPLGTASSGTLALQAPLPTDTPVLFEVAACAGPVVQSASPPVQVPTATPQLNAATYDGRSVAARWTPAANPPLPVSAYRLRVASTLTGSAWEALIDNAQATGGTLPLPAPLNPSDDLTFSVLALTGTGASSSATVPVVTVQPVIKSAIYQSTSVAVEWTPVTNAPVPLSGYSLDVYASDGSRVASATVNDPAASTGTIVPASPLPAGGTFTLQVSTLSASQAVSAASERLTLVGVAPTVQSAGYDGETLTVTWSPVPDASITGYVVTISGVQPGVFFTGREPVLRVPLALAFGSPYQIAVRSFGPSAAGLQGPAFAWSLPELPQPAIVFSRVTEGAATVKWAPVAAPWLTGYRVTLVGTPAAGAATTLSFQLGGVTSLEVPLPPSPTGVWTAAVAATAGEHAGPPSAPALLLTAVPVITSVAVAGGSATVAWTLAGTTPALLAALQQAKVQVRVQLLDGTNVVADGLTAVSAVSGSTEIALPALDGGAPVAVGQLIAVDPQGGVALLGAKSGAVAVIVDAPTITFGAIVDGVLTLRWKPVNAAAVTGYVVTCGASVVGTSDAWLEAPVAGADLAAGTITVAAVCPNGTGPSATLPLVAAYTVQGGEYDGSALSVSLGSPGGTAPDRTWVDVLLNGVLAARTTVRGAPGGAVRVPVALPPGAAASVRASGVGPGALTLPAPPLSIPTTAPGSLAAVYDGAALHVSWTPVPDPGVTGYVVDVAGATLPVTPFPVAGAGTSSVSIPAAFTLPFGPGAAVTIQAVAAVGDSLLSGPASPAAAPTLAGYLRGIATAAAGQPPYLYRAGEFQALASVSAADVVAYLPNPFTGEDNPTVPSGSGQTFQLLPAPAGSALPYQLVIAQSVWTSFGAGDVRGALRTAYRDFLVAVEQAGAAPWAIRLVRQAVAQALPQTFAETLYYRYGVWRDDSLRVADLEPGLRLRVAGSLYQLVSDALPDVRNGFTAAGAQDFDLAEAIPSGVAVPTPDGPARALTVDAFLSLLLPGASGAVTSVAAGPIDFFQGNRETYYRLFYPQRFPDSGGIGDRLITGNVAVIGASSWQALESATDRYAQTGSFPPDGDLFATFFRGRATLTPMLALTVAGEPRWVPVGTTLRQVLASIGLAVWPGGGMGGGVRLSRAVSGLFDQPFGGEPLRFEQVDLSDAVLAAQGPTLWPLDLPVLGGDRIEVARGPGAGG